MAGDRLDAAIGRDKIHDDTAAGLSGMVVAGFFIGLGTMVLIYEFSLLEMVTPLVGAGVCIAGGVLMAYISLRRVPDALTVATFVEEVQDLER